MLRKAISDAGVSIVDCHSSVRGLGFYIDLYKKLGSLNGKFDVLFIGNSGPSYFLPLFAKVITRCPVVWEPLFSIYDNYVFDRKLAPKWSLKAGAYFLMDLIGSHAADRIILDTDSNCRYFERTFHIKKGKCHTVLTGADTTIFQTVTKTAKDDYFDIEYHGKYIPIHGIDTVIKAADLLKSDKKIRFTLIGKGQMYKSAVNQVERLGLTNISFVPFLPQEELKKYIANADVTLGLLGDVPRIARAIPGKLYEAAAMSRVTINADSPALREVFTPGVDVVAIPPGDAEALANAIGELKRKGNARDMGRDAYKTFWNKSSPSHLSEAVKTVFNSLP